MQDHVSDGVASGFVCPTCGGTLWERRGHDGHGFGQPHAAPLRFACRIGHRFEAAELWIEHCAARNRPLQSAARTLAENAALARRLAAWIGHQGDGEAAARLEEAAEEDRLYEQVRRMTEGLPELAGGPA